MIKLIRNIAVIAATVLIMASCSGNGIDTERIMQYAQNQDSTLTESDYDFFINQMEVIANKTKDMDTDQANEYYQGLPEEERQAILIVNLVLMSADDKLTDEQKERLQSLQ